MIKELAGKGIFDGINEKELPALLECLHAEYKTYKKGEMIFTEGEIIDRMGIVISGMAVMESSDAMGNNSVIGSAGPGAVFAETYACMKNEPLMVSVSAAEKSEILFLNINRIFGACSDQCGFHSRLTRNLLTVCAGKNLQLSRRILHTSSKTIRGRLMSYFSECVKKHGSSFDIVYNRQQLADYLGVDRSAMCHELSKMQSEGIINYSRNHFTVNTRQA